jgi:hypothetical protein
VIDALLADFRAGSYRAVGIAYAITTVPPGRTEPTDAITTVPPGRTEPTDAIVIRLDHVSGYSVQVVYPYLLGQPGDLTVASPFAVRGLGDVFPPPGHAS